MSSCVLSCVGQNLSPGAARKEDPSQYNLGPQTLPIGRQENGKTENVERAVAKRQRNVPRGFPIGKSGPA